MHSSTAEVVQIVYIHLTCKEKMVANLTSLVV